MKTFRTVLPLAVVTVIAVSSCKKEEPQPETTSPPPSSTPTPAVVKKPLFAMIEESIFDAPMSYGQLTSGSVMIDGHDGSKIMVLNIPPDAEVGLTHTLGTSPAYALHYSPNNYVTIFTAVSGSITVTKSDISAKKVEGTFDGTVLSADSTVTLTITGGQFNCTYN